jgi:hypothetical protein
MVNKKINPNRDPKRGGAWFLAQCGGGTVVDQNEEEGVAEQIKSIICRLTSLRQ